MIEIWQARYVIAVADAGSFRAAAQALSMSQPPLSRAIAAIEAQLGANLFERHPRGVTLTAAGVAFRREARQLLHQADAVMAAARGEPPGKQALIIAFEGPTARAALPRIVGRLRNLPGEPEITLREMPSVAQVRALKAGEIDAGLVVPPLRDAELTVTLIGKEPLLLVVPPDHRLAGRNDVDVAELVGERWVTGARGARNADSMPQPSPSAARRASCRRSRWTPVTRCSSSTSWRRGSA
ncbi:LysR family transcriptional regulator [Roseomonas sp. CCTCC AB2023176]|uniref:LysR family transcriptional regulator n=1 Tax=Roseomonas sp. CCTCC AB2023176 TaxID=3342640 RepID=UPI0035DA9ABD